MPKEEWKSHGVKAEVAEANTEINRKDYGSPIQQNPAGKKKFKLVRQLVNFEVLETATKTPAANPTLTLTVCYKQQDITGAGGIEKLKLGVYLDGEWDYLWEWKQNDPRMVACTEPGFVGAVEVKLKKKWADPPIGWGGGGG